MRPIIPCWLLGVILFWILSWRLTRSSRREIRIPLRSLGISLACAPTAIIGGWNGFPAPASLVLIGHFWETRPYSKGYLDNLRFAGLAFSGFFVITLLAYTIMVWMKEKKNHASHTA